MRSIFVALVVVQLGCAGTRADGTPPPSSAQPAAPVASTAAAQKANGSAPATADPTGTGVKAFVDRVNAYVALRAKADNGIPKLRETPDPKEIAERERALGEALMKARAGVKVGDIFVPEAQPALVKIIKDDFAKRTPAERKALIVELPKGMKFGINQIYPTTIPLATFPPNLLKALPEIPSDIEYRIVHRNLILRDVKGNYVIDMMPDVFPIPM